MSSHQNSTANLWKNDIMLFLVILIVSALLLLVFRDRNHITGSYAVVSVDGSRYTSIPLSEDNTIAITTDHGTNIVCVSSGEVSVIEADCPDKICVDHAAIKYSGESIVCLPHRLVVTVEGTKEAEFDAVSQ